MKKARRLLFVIACLCGCKSSPYGKVAVGLNGMAYDFENRPLSQYLVTLSGRATAATDINGRFFFPGVKPGSYTLSGEKEGYESYGAAITVSDRRQIVYLRVPNRSQLIALADEALSRNRIGEAESYMRRAENIGEPTTEVLFYAAVVFFRQGQYQEAADRLRIAVSRGARDPYVTRFLDDLAALTEKEKQSSGRTP
jgi:hypothetical protein